MGKKADPKAQDTNSTAYVFFLKACKEEHEIQHPGVKLDFAVFSRKCSEKWSTMIPEEIDLFEEMAKRQKMRYETELASHMPPPVEQKKPKKKRVKDPNAPKRSLSAFFFFCKDERPKSLQQNPNLKPSEIATMLGQKWKTMSPEVKGMYEKKATKDKLRYKKEMDIFKSRQAMEALAEKPPPKPLSEDEDDEVEEISPPPPKVAKITKPEIKIPPVKQLPETDDSEEDDDDDDDDDDDESDDEDDDDDDDE